MNAQQPKWCRNVTFVVRMCPVSLRVSTIILKQQLFSNKLGDDIVTVTNHVLTISVLQACCAVTTEYGIPSNFVRKSTASLQVKISTAQLNFSNRNIILF